MTKKVKNSLIILGLAAMLVSFFVSCSGETPLKLDPSIVAGPSKVTTIEGNDTQIAVLLSDFEKTPETVDVYKNEEETAIVTAAAVTVGARKSP